MKINNQTLPVEKHPKILGVYLDNMMNFTHHVNTMGNKLLKRNNAIKIIAGNWDCCKEIITVSYKAISRNVLNYAVPIWRPKIIGKFTTQTKRCIKSSNWMCSHDTDRAPTSRNQNSPSQGA